MSEESLKNDFTISGLYQSFSAEILRLALLGITGYGFILGGILDKPDQLGSVLESWWFKAVAIFGVSAFAVATIAALLHRYFSSDCITHMVRRCRLKEQSQALQDKGMLAGGPTQQVIYQGGGLVTMHDWATLSLEDQKAKVTSFLKDEADSLYTDFKRCRLTLTISGYALAFGALAVALLFVFIFSSHSSPLLPAKDKTAAVLGGPAQQLAPAKWAIRSVVVSLATQPLPFWELPSYSLASLAW